MAELSGARRVPVLTDVNRGFWTSGADGVLRVSRCCGCRFWIHPPAGMCPRCRRRDLSWDATRGTALVYTYTVNRKAWNPEVGVPYLLAIVELPEQPGLRMTTDLVNCAVDEVSIGMPVRVIFVQQDEVFIPLFEPA